MSTSITFSCLVLSLVALRTIQCTEHRLYCGKLDIRIGGSAKACYAGGCLDLDIGDGLCSGSLLKGMLGIGEQLEIGYIALIERLHKRINGTIATAMQFAHDTVDGDAGAAGNDLQAILPCYILHMKRFEGKRPGAVQIFFLEGMEDLDARKFLATFVGKLFDHLADEC